MPAPTINPRPYQVAAHDGIRACWADKPSTLAVMATGLGKTVLAAMVALERMGLGRVLFICHREELVWQAAEKMHAVTGLQPGIEMANYAAHGDMFGRTAPVVIATVQTMFSGWQGRGRMSRYDPAEFSTLIVDEAHHYTAAAYARVVAYFRQNPALRLLGITATPDRADGVAMGKIFESVAFDYGIRAGIDDGWLVPVDPWTGTLSELNLSEIGSVAGDLNAKQLEAVMEQKANLFGVADKTLERVGRRKTLVFASGVRHAELLAAILNDRRPGSARWVSGETNTDVRRQMFADFAAYDGDRRGFQFLVNVGVATEGFDDPGIECVVIARPTKSRSLFTQMCGRGTRVLPGVVDQYEHAEDRKVSIAESAKPGMMLIDFAGNAGRHKLVGPLDILGGDYDADVVSRAKQKATDADRARPSEELLAEAQAEIDAERLAEERERADEAARLARLRFEAQCRFERVNVFDRETTEAPRREVWSEAGERPTDAQLAFLARHAPRGTEVELLTRGQAGRLVGEIRRRFKSGLCTLNQKRVLERQGLPGDILRETANAWLNEISANDWRVPRGIRLQAQAMMINEAG